MNVREKLKTQITRAAERLVRAKREMDAAEKHWEEAFKRISANYKVNFKIIPSQPPLPMPPPRKFFNPDESLDCVKTTCYPSSRRIAYFDGLHNRRGTMQNTINILTKKLEDELKRIGFNDYDPDRYERLVNGLTIQLPFEDGTIVIGGGDTGSPIAQHAERPDSAVPNDGRAVKSMASTPNLQPVLPCDAGKQHEGQGRTTSGQKRKKTG